MPLPSPQKFGEFLAKSLLSEKAKQIILKKLPTLTKEQINEIYSILEQEQDKIEQTKSQFESKLALTEMKFEQGLENISNDV